MQENAVRATPTAARRGDAVIQRVPLRRQLRLLGDLFQASHSARVRPRSDLTVARQTATIQPPATRAAVRKGGRPGDFDGTCWTGELTSQRRQERGQARFMRRCLRWAAALVMVAALGFPTTTSAQGKPPSFRSPTQDELTRTTSGSADWITYGGALNNERYSTLDQINTTTVQGLRGAWMTRLGS